MLGLTALSLVEGAMGTSNEVNAREVLAKIKANQQTEFDNYIIVGDLNLSALKIEEPVHFNHTLFRNSVNFKSATLNGPAYFEGSSFENDADFRHSMFNSDADFGSSSFNGTANFEFSKFNGTADFWYSKFNSYADFGYSTFNGTANFLYSKFNGTADFRSASFNGSAYFMSSKFNGHAYFWSSSFNDTADFVSSKFNDANFGSSSFNGTADFGSSSFNGTANFEFSKFNGTANFVSSKFNGFANFESSKFNGTANFLYSKFNDFANFDNVDFEKETTFNDIDFNGSASFKDSKFADDALFLNATFNRVLYLTRTKYDKLYIRWDNIHSLAFDDAAYQLLIENFKKLGFNKDADNCYYQFRVDQFEHWQPPHKFQESRLIQFNKRIQDSLAYIIDGVAWLTYGYGKMPLLPFFWSICTILLFGIIWWIGGLKDRPDKSRRLIEAMIFSTTIFLSGTRLFIDPPEIPEMPKWSKFQVRVAFTAERVLGAFFSILLFIAIGATVVRQ